MTLLRQRKIVLINQCNAKYDEETLVKAMLWYSVKPLQSKKKVTMHGKYACVSIGNKKIHIHRLLGMYIINNKSIDSKMHFHHINGDKLDNRIENIAMIDGSLHLSSHNKNKKTSDYCRRRIIESNHKRKGGRTKLHRKDITAIDVYNLKKQGLSFNQIAIKLNLDWGCVKRRYYDAIHDNPELKGGEE